MSKFRKVGVTPIEATQWFKNGDHPLDYAEDRQGLEHGKLVTFPKEQCRENDWGGAVVRRYRTPELDGGDLCRSCGQLMHDHGYIDGLVPGFTGSPIVCPGDFVVTRTDGTFYRVSKEYFNQNYEPWESPCSSNAMNPEWLNDEAP